MPLTLAGITTLLALGILESIQEQGLIGNLLDMEHNSAEYLHTLIEALRFSSSSLCIKSEPLLIPIQNLKARLCR